MSFNHASNFIISGGVFNHIIQTQRTGFEHLASKAVLSATHDSGESFDRPKCLENTRVAILKRLRDWFLGEAESEGIMWLYGDAGAGKSAIAQTLAERFAREQRLLGSFFFSRNDAQRATHIPLVATIAYHAATTMPELKEPIISAVDRDPRIFDKTLQTQFATLILDPLNTVKARSSQPGQVIPHFLIIDGLDECTDRRLHRHILEVLLGELRKCHYPLKVLVASRPETEILSTFNSQALSAASTRLALDASEFKSDNDIRFLLESTFENIKATHPHRSFIPQTWPSNDILGQLVRKSSGKFIFASTVAKYISSERHKPVERLEIVLGLKPPSSDTDLPFAELDALYLHIFSTIPKENLDIVLFILGILVLRPDSPEGHPPRFSLGSMWFINSFLPLEAGNLEFLLRDLSSIVKCIYSHTKGIDSAIQITHASVADFLLDPRRSKEFHIDHMKFYTQMVQTSLRRLNNGISRSLPDPFSQEAYIMCYLFEILPSALERASMTPEIREDISRFPLMSVVQWFGGMPFSSGLGPSFCFQFALQFVHQLEVLPNAQELFSHHQKEFDGCMHHILQKYHPDHKIFAITTLIGLTHSDSSWSQEPRATRIKEFLPKADLLGRLFFRDFFSPWLSVSTHRDFDLIVDIGPCSPPERVHTILQFFSDTRRSKDYALSGTRYAAASLTCITNICGEVICKAAHDQENRSHKHFVVTFCVGCVYLPQLLARSNATSELIEFLRGGHFERAYAGYNYHTLAGVQFDNFKMEELVPNVLKAIQTYLQCYDPENKKKAERVAQGRDNERNDDAQRLEKRRRL